MRLSSDRNTDNFSIHHRGSPSWLPFFNVSSTYNHHRETVVGSLSQKPFGQLFLHSVSGLSWPVNLDLHCQSGFSDLKSADLHCQSGFPDLKSPDLHCRSDFSDLKSLDLHCRWGGNSEFISGPKGRPYVCSSSSRRSSQSCLARQGFYEKKASPDIPSKARLFYFVLLLSAFFFSAANRRSTFFTSSAGGRSSGTIPRSIIIWRTAALLSTCSRLISDSP